VRLVVIDSLGLQAEVYNRSAARAHVPAFATGSGSIVTIVNQRVWA
jgi:hypothetical protein